MSYEQMGLMHVALYHQLVLGVPQPTAASENSPQAALTYTEADNPGAIIGS